MAVDYCEWGNLIFDEESFEEKGFDMFAINYVRLQDDILKDGNIETIEWESYDGKTRGTYIMNLTNDENKTTILNLIEQLKSAFYINGIRYNRYGICIDVELRKRDP